MSEVTVPAERPIVSLPAEEGYDAEGRYFATHAAVQIPTAEEFDELKARVERLERGSAGQKPEKGGEA